MLDQYAVSSRHRAAAAAEAGYFDREILKLDVEHWASPGNATAIPVFERDETIRPNTSLERLATLKPSFREDGRVTAGNASQISDGASAVLLMVSEVAQSLKIKPRARIRAMTTVGSDPTHMLTGPISATQRVLDRAGLALDVFEVNEAFERLG